MGICISCEAMAVAPATTAKVILPDGELREYDQPVRVAHVLQKDPTCFVCDADGMEFDGFVSAIGADEELRPGNLYFLLPKTMLKHPLHPEDLAALAVRASSALMKAASAPLVFDVGARKDAAVSGGVPAAEEERRKLNRRGRGTGGKFMPGLSAIPE